MDWLISSWITRLLETTQWVCYSCRLESFGSPSVSSLLMFWRRYYGFEIQNKRHGHQHLHPARVSLFSLRSLDSVFLALWPPLTDTLFSILVSRFIPCLWCHPILHLLLSKVVSSLHWNPFPRESFMPFLCLLFAVVSFLTQPSHSSSSWRYITQNINSLFCSLILKLTIFSILLIPGA